MTMTTKKTRRAIYAGTFDPFTNGHHDILMRALEIFDHITVLIAIAPKKRPMLTEEERAAMIREHLGGDRRIAVDSWAGLVVDYARRQGIRGIVRGLRPTGDFETEFQMASMNKRLGPEIETLFLTTGLGNYFVSSSLIKELWDHGKDISGFVPPSILKAMEAKRKKT